MIITKKVYFTCVISKRSLGSYTGRLDGAVQSSDFQHSILTALTCTRTDDVIARTQQYQEAVEGR